MGRELGQEQNGQGNTVPGTLGQGNHWDRHTHTHTQRETLGLRTGDTEMRQEYRAAAKLKQTLFQ